MFPDDAQTHIPTKTNFGQNFKRDEFNGIVMNESELLCLFVLVIYFILSSFLLSLFYFFLYFHYYYLTLKEVGTRIFNDSGG